MLYDQLDRNRRMTFVLFAAFALVVFGVSWAIDELFLGAGLTATSVIAGLIAVGAGLFAWFLADKVVLSTLGAREPRADVPAERNLVEIVRGVSIAAGLPMPKVYVIDEAAPNALATGRSPEKGVVAFTTGLLDKMTRQQVEAVAAHEISHIANRDSLVGVVAAVLLGVMLIISRLAFRLLFFGGGRRRSSRSGGGGGGAVIMLVIGLAVLVLAPILGALLRFAISRRRESLADANAVRLTRNPQAMIEALEVLAGDHSSVDFRHGLAAHLWMEEPEDEAGQSWLDRLFATHPPIPDRIRTLKAIAGHLPYR